MAELTIIEDPRGFGGFTTADGVMWAPTREGLQQRYNALSSQERDQVSQWAAARQEVTNLLDSGQLTADRWNDYVTSPVAQAGAAALQRAYDSPNTGTTSTGTTSTGTTSTGTTSTGGTGTGTTVNMPSGRPGGPISMGGAANPAGQINTGGLADLGGSNFNANVPVWGPDGQRYASIGAALAAGVTNYSFARPQFAQTNATGLISGADTLTSIPAAATGNVNPGGLIAGQNNQLFNAGPARVALPGGVRNPFAI